ncbi:MAG: HD domain-containing protein [Bdellovibrionales bacterium]|nr:HD domain-containing protein [Bdellovibrionales bacterium]
MLTFNLEGMIPAQITWVESFHDVVDFLLEDVPIDVFICQDYEDTNKLLKYLLTVNVAIPYILVGPGEVVDPDSFPDIRLLERVDSIYSVEQIADVVVDAIENEVIVPEKDNTEFFRIATELLLKVVPLKADIYIRLSKIKFVKMFRKGREFKPDDAKRYLESKKVNYLYIKKDDMNEFIGHFQNMLENILNSDHLSSEDQALLSASVHESIAEMQKLVGFTPEVKKLAEEGVRLTLRSIGKSPKLKNFMSTLDQYQGSYFSAHAIATAHVSCALALALHWPSDTTFKKLTLAAYFHDIALDQPEFSEFDGVDHILNTKPDFGGETEKRYRSHPYLASEMLKDIAEVPPDVDVIIMQHHERPDGSGFPRGLRHSQISPLAAVFIVAHDYVRFLFEDRYLLGREGFKRRFDYSEDSLKGTFKKAVEAIEF